MVRTQIYLTREEHAGLHTLARRSGKKRSEIIRQAIDLFLDRTSPGARVRHLQRYRGLWKDRGLSAFRDIRKEVNARMSG